MREEHILTLDEGQVVRVTVDEEGYVEIYFDQPGPFSIRDRAAIVKFVNNVGTEPE